MTERPILFSDAMVRAILSGQKTQTRRVVTAPVEFIGGSGDDRSDPDNWGFYAESSSFAGWVVLARNVHRLVGNNQDRASLACPYGVPGDRLWVRETFASFQGSSVPVTPSAATYVVMRDGTQVYRSDSAIIPPAKEYADGAFDGIKWRPSIHMPRWACRLVLEVTDVHVERLNDITEADARAEGVTLLHGIGDDQTLPGEPRGRTFGTHPHACAFCVLWDSINGERAPWSSNPWVWVVSFRRAA